MLVKWVHCPKCHHKLMKVDTEHDCWFEVKCHSCKYIVFVNVKESKIKAKARLYEGRQEENAD